MEYDLIVIGSGPAGQKGAIVAAKMGKKVALVERKQKCIGGICLHHGTIPSKTMREAILHLTGFRHRDVYAELYRGKRKIKMADLQRKLHQVVSFELDVIYDQLERNGVDMVAGEARFVNENEIQIEGPHGVETLHAKNFLIACGTKPARPSHIPFDGEQVFDSDQLLHLSKIPKSMVVVGSGVIGIEYGIMFATLGCRVTMVDGRERILEFCDREIVDTLLFHARTFGITFRLGESVTNIETRNDSVAVELESEKRVVSDAVLYAVGRIGDSDSLHLQAIGLEADDRGRITCDEFHQTRVPNVFAVGDIVGFPALASTAMEQGRRAVCHIFGEDWKPFPHLPYGLFTIPEMSMVGRTEEQLTKEKVPYEIGIARFAEVARGKICGDENGILKLLFHRETRKLLGVHCIGESATEIIHIGQAVLAHDGIIDYFCDAVFNYPTLAECYKVAAFDGLHRLDIKPTENLHQWAPAPVSSSIPIVSCETNSSSESAVV